MKRYILYFLLGIIFMCGCSEGLKGVESDYTIKVTGSDLSVSDHEVILNSLWRSKKHTATMTLTAINSNMGQNHNQSH